MRKRIAITHVGCAGHYIGAKHCRWHRHTQVGDLYRVSTIGNYLPPGNSSRDTLGGGETDFFETMVFHTGPAQDAESEGCGCHEVLDWCERYGRRYATAQEAQAGHDATVETYAELAQEQITEKGKKRSWKTKK